MTAMMPLSTEEIEVIPHWSTHYFKMERDFTLFESADQWQWFIHGELLDIYPQQYGMLTYSSPINRGGND